MVWKHGPNVQGWEWRVVYGRRLVENIQSAGTESLTFGIDSRDACPEMSMNDAPSTGGPPDTRGNKQASRAKMFDS